MAPVQTSHIGPQPGGMAANGLVIGSAAVSCMLRFYTRKLSKAGLGADDWLIMVAVIIMTPMAALLARVDTIDSDSLYATESANADYNHTAEEALYYKIGLASMVIYYSIVGATKLGILLMYFRLFNISTSFRIQLFIVSGLVLGWWIGCTIAILTCCIPLRIEVLLRPGTCFNINYFWMVSGACEVMLDTMILTVPISVVARMNLSLKRKCMVSGIFLLGGFVVLTGLVRTILGYREGSLMIFYSRAKVWTAYHICIGIVCASLPISGPLVQRAKSLCCSRKKKEVNFSYPLRPNAKSVQTPEVALVL